MKILTILNAFFLIACVQSQNFTFYDSRTSFSERLDNRTQETALEGLVGLGEYTFNWNWGGGRGHVRSTPLWVDGFTFSGVTFAALPEVYLIEESPNGLLNGRAMILGGRRILRIVPDQPQRAIGFDFGRLATSDGTPMNVTFITADNVGHGFPTTTEGFRGAVSDTLIKEVILETSRFDEGPFLAVNRVTVERPAISLQSPVGSALRSVSPSVLRTNGQVGSPATNAPKYDIKINAPDLAGKWVRIWIEPSIEDFGHYGHTGLRPTGFLLKEGETVPLDGSSAGGWNKTTRRSFDTSEDFRFLVPESGILVLPDSYAAPELAQSESLFIQDEGSTTPSGSWKISVALQNMTLLPESSTISHIGGRSHHGSNPGTHYGTTSLVSALQELSIPFKRLLGFKLSVNDMSLPFGGMFDNGSWGYGSQDAHFGHRDGNDVDLAVTYMNPTLEKILVGQDRFYIDRGLWASEVSHYHLRVNNPTPRPFIIHTKTELLQELPSNTSEYRLTFLNIGGSDASDVSMTLKGRGLTIVSEDLTTPFSLAVDTVITKTVRVKFGGFNAGTVEVSGTALGQRSSPIGAVNLTTSPPRVDANIPIQLARTSEETSVTSVSLGPISILHPEQAAGRVTLNKAPNSAFIVPVSILPNDGLLKLDPPTLSVAAGSQSLDFKVYSLRAPDVTTTYTLRFGGIERALTLKEKVPTVKGFTIAPANIVGGNEALGTITLDKAATANFQVIVRDNDSRTTVPATVLVPEGELSATFVIGSKGTNVKFSSIVTVTRAKVALTRPVEVYPPALDTFSISPTVVKGGNPGTGTVTMTGKAPASGVYMNVTSDGPEATVPAIIGFPQNVKTVTFQVVTKVVAARTIRTITVSHAGLTRTKTITINK